MSAVLLGLLGAGLVAVVVAVFAAHIPGVRVVVGARPVGPVPAPGEISCRDWLGETFAIHTPDRAGVCVYCCTAVFEPGIDVRLAAAADRMEEQARAERDPARRSAGLMIAAGLRREAGRAER